MSASAVVDRELEQDAVRTARARQRAAAEALGLRLSGLVRDPAAFVDATTAGLAALADPGARRETERVAPGIGPTHGVRWPLLEKLERSFARATKDARTSGHLDLVDRLLRVPTLEERWFAFSLLDLALEDDPVLVWQDMRRAAREAADWITVDTLAHPVGRGVLLEGFRWAELEQLVFSPSRWERRLVGATIATIPFVDRRAGRDPSVAARAMPILRMLMGDDAPEVQKALSWALRNLTLVDRDAVAAFCEEETRRAVETGDGHRAWVVRDALPKLDPEAAARLKTALAGIRRRKDAPSTSEAAALAARFAGPGGLPDPADLPAPRMPRHQGDA
jgi:3-methyladenine DNA glycosylase AlkD